MRVEDKQSLKGIDGSASKSTGDKVAVLHTQGDKVSLEGVKQVQAIVSAVQANLSADRTNRLQELENAIRQGGYRPDAGQLAERIVQAAEIDARLRAIFGG